MPAAIAMLAFATAGEQPWGGQAQPGPAPVPFNRNEAMPNPKDLIRFDDRPISPDQIVELDELGVRQGAFPVYYGAKSVVPSSGRYDAAPPAPGPAYPAYSASPLYPIPGGPSTPGAPMMSIPTDKYDGMTASRPEGTADIVVPLGATVISTGSALITTTSSGEGFVDYQDYLNRARARDAAPSETAMLPVAPVVERIMPTPGDSIVPPPPPQELLDQARAAAAAPAAPMLPPPPPPSAPMIPPVVPEAPAAPAQPAAPEVAAATPAPAANDPDASAMEPFPLPPPPLPDLPNHRAPRPDLNKVRTEFAKLREFCEKDSLGSAAEVFAGMPDFGPDEELNRIRADAANLLILALSRNGNLPAARRIYESLPAQIVGFEATLAKARAIINLTTYYVRADQYNDAYAVLMDVGSIQNRSALNNELFRLMARMIPYLDNAEETEKAQSVFDLLIQEVKSPGTAALFADNAHGIIRYYLHYVDRSESPQRRGKRLDVLEHIYVSLGTLSSNPDIADLRRGLGMDLTERFSGDPERAARFRMEN